MDLAVYLGTGEIASGVGDGFEGWIYVDEEDESDGSVVCGEIVDWGGAPPCPGFGICRPPVCIPRRVIAIRDSVIADRDIVYV